MEVRFNINITSVELANTEVSILRTSFTDKLKDNINKVYKRDKANYDLVYVNCFNSILNELGLSAGFSAPKTEKLKKIFAENFLAQPQESLDSKFYSFIRTLELYVNNNISEYLEMSSEEDFDKVYVEQYIHYVRWGIIGTSSDVPQKTAIRNAETFFNINNSILNRVIKPFNEVTKEELISWIEKEDSGKINFLKNQLIGDIEKMGLETTLIEAPWSGGE